MQFWSSLSRYFWQELAIKQFFCSLISDEMSVSHSIKILIIIALKISKSIYVNPNPKITEKIKAPSTGITNVFYSHLISGRGVYDLWKLVSILMILYI